MLLINLYVKNFFTTTPNMDSTPYPTPRLTPTPSPRPSFERNLTGDIILAVLGLGAVTLIYTCIYCIMQISNFYRVQPLGITFGPLNSPLDQFETGNLLSLDTPILANLYISLTSFGLYLTITALTALNLLFFSQNAPRPHAFVSLLAYLLTYLLSQSFSNNAPKP